MSRCGLAKTMAALLPIVFCVPAWSEGTDISESLKACAAETDDARRLACFDEIMSPKPADAAVSEPEAAATSAATAGVAIAAAETAAPAAVPAEAAAPEAGSAAEARPAPEAASDAVDNFGRTGGDKKALKQISATVVEVSRLPYGEAVVTLDNGQVWVEKDATFGFKIEVGDEAVIKRGTFGGYKLMGRGRRSSPVRRVE